MKKLLSLFSLMTCLCLFLSGCGNASRQIAQVAVTLPPAQSPCAAPAEDETPSRAAVYALYLPDESGALAAVNVRLTLNPFLPAAGQLAQALLSYRGEDGTALPRQEYLALAGPVEVSCGVATVNLTRQALSLSREQLYTVFQALANTLCQTDGVTAVNLTVDGAAPGLDAACETPAGLLRANRTDDLSTLWGRAVAQKNALGSAQRLSQEAALYFPAQAGMGILCESRALAFSSADPAALTRMLLDALSQGATVLEGLPDLPALTSLLAADPEISGEGTDKILTLRFQEGLNDALLTCGVPRSALLASLVYTLTGYLPGVSGLTVQIGDSLVSSASPEGTYTGAGSTILFENGVIRRSQMSLFLLSRCTLYFADANGALCPAERDIPWDKTRDPRSLISQLTLGPRYYDVAARGLTAAFPTEMTDSDLIGVSWREDGTVALNFSPWLGTLCQRMDREGEAKTVYALVNTLTELTDVTQVCLFIDGRQEGLQTLSLAGVFLHNPDIIAR